jgi:DNA-binding LytR/AlgR family response regulator
MPTAIIADDEPHMREMLRDQLRQLWPDLTIVAEAADGPSALIEIETKRPDIAFLDIRMPGLTGLQVAHAKTAPTRTVFVTAYDNHAVEAFEAHALDYVLKPVETVRLTSVVARLKSALESAAAASAEQLMAALARLGVDVSAAAPPVAERLEWLQIADGQQRVHMLHVEDVLYFESDSKYTRVVSEDLVGHIRLSLKDLLGKLDGTQYLQTHRGAIVNRKFIKAVHRVDDAMEVELRGRNERIKVSTANVSLFKAM